MATSLNDKVREFYDASSTLWEQVWGEHMHHGYYGVDGDQKKDPHQAQIDLIEELLRWADVTEAKYILDVGCGIGGSSRYLSRKLNAEVIGVTLSPVQVERAREITQQNHITQPLLFMVEDALSPSFPPESFDLIWALESAEHIPRKSKLLWNWHQLLKPGGKVLFATWCHRPVPPELNTREQQQLHQLYEVFSLSPLISMDMYGALMEDVGFRNIELADWSAAVAPFWNAVIRKTRNPLNWIKILRSGKLVRNSVKGVKLMRELYKTGLIRFVVARGVK